MNARKPQNEGVDTVVRFHDLRRLRELERAIFSLVGQELRPLRIILVLQRLGEDGEQQVRTRLAPLLSLPNAPELTVLRFDETEPADARSVLVNLGFRSVTARYVALLDYDDVLYPEAYRMLTDQLRNSESGIAFANIGVRSVDVYEGFMQATACLDPFTGSTLSDFFRSNFCPIHSFLVDRTRVQAEELRFEPSQTIEEDYEFLIRICAKVESDFTLSRTRIGEYYYKTDESNTVAGLNSFGPVVRMRIEAAGTFIEGRRRLTTLAERVQRQLGLSEYRPGLTIRAFLDGSFE